MNHNVARCSPHDGCHDALNNSPLPDLALLARALNCMTDAVCVTDVGDSIVFANDAFLRMHGYQRETLYGQSIMAICEAC